MKIVWIDVSPMFSLTRKSPETKFPWSSLLSKSPALVFTLPLQNVRKLSADYLLDPYTWLASIQAVMLLMLVLTFFYGFVFARLKAICASPLHSKSNFKSHIGTFIGAGSSLLLDVSVISWSMNWPKSGCRRFAPLMSSTKGQSTDPIKLLISRTFGFCSHILPIPSE